MVVEIGGGSFGCIGVFEISNLVHEFTAFIHIYIYYKIQQDKEIRNSQEIVIEIEKNKMVVEIGGSSLLLFISNLVYMR
ncbi:hypothetical protein O9G_005450 [Rozella allomycis CSF55]|uniref:Uncharacterized protein n=1 Tax=Rozella allomycis (strain CSF55) TaxID=988480 RepID=A0A075ANL9_ROZAC|nr:hypothetical protein O9G_005450 [Rozella allomycis CSF55]|eukprot:EPZ31495.1 hypothetical protein O9G_005450 [Rozella allomycis CSF55]